MTVATFEQVKEQCREAAKQIRKLKIANPYIFPEYNRLMEAKNAFKRAQAELNAAQAAWNRLGNNS
jgi:hypothetical protein